MKHRKESDAVGTENYEITVRDIDGTLLHKGTYPVDAIIMVLKNTYPKELDGWCYSDIVFSNLTEEKKSKLLEQLTDQDPSYNKDNDLV